MFRTTGKRVRSLENWTHAERKILPTLGVLFSGEIDQFKGESNVGFGIQFETAGSHEIMMAQQGLDPNGNPLQ